MMRLIVIEESFAEQLPSWLSEKEIKRFNAKLQDEENITVVEYRVCASALCRVVSTVCARLHPSRYYAHLVEKNRLIVMFRECAFNLRRGDQRTIKLCREVGNKLGIPNAELQFEMMFDVDHPDLNHD